jgi:hypothetical protein
MPLTRIPVATECFPRRVPFGYPFSCSCPRLEAFPKGSCASNVTQLRFASSFHGGNTGSNPVGDAKISKNLQFFCSFI